MSKIITNSTVPGNSIILNGFKKIDYCDSYRINVVTNDSVDKIAYDLFQSPKWVENLMRIRDLMVGWLGLKTGDAKKEAEQYYPIGSQLEYFTVTDRNDNEIIMAEDDKHLNFRVSVLIERNENFTSIYLTTIVKFNNFFGKLYFLPVKPFHKLIVKSTVKRYARDLM